MSGVISEKLSFTSHFVFPTFSSDLERDAGTVGQTRDEQGPPAKPPAAVFNRLVFCSTVCKCLFSRRRALHSSHDLSRCGGKNKPQLLSSSGEPERKVPQAAREHVPWLCHLKVALRDVGTNSVGVRVCVCICVCTLLVCMRGVCWLCSSSVWRAP